MLLKVDTGNAINHQATALEINPIAKRIFAVEKRDAAVATDAVFDVFIMGDEV